YKEAEVEYQLQNAEVRAIIAGRDLYPMVAAVRANVPSLELAITTAYSDYLPQQPTLPVPEELRSTPECPADTEDLVKILAQQEPLAQSVPVSLWDDIGLMTFTSGTTGRPKGAMLSYGSSLIKTAARFLGNRVETGNTTLAVAPSCHIAGMNSGIYMPVYTRSTATSKEHTSELQSRENIV